MDWCALWFGLYRVFRMLCIFSNANQVFSPCFCGGCRHLSLLGYVCAYRAGDAMNDDDVDKAREWLISNAPKRANAKAHRTYCEEYRKILKAILFNEAEGTISARENEAYASDRYVEHIGELKDAVFEDEHYKALTHAAEMKIEIWRTRQANQRAARV